MDLDNADRLSREQMRQVAKAKGILSPDEIRGIRKGLGLTQEEFQRLLGVSSPAVSRWETGAMLPSKTTDNLMRVIAEVPEAVAFLMDREPDIEFKVKIALDDPAPTVRYVREVTNGHVFDMKFIDPIFPEDQTITREFYIVGIRHHAGCCGSDCNRLPRVKEGDEVTLRPEPDNAFDEFALTVHTQEGEMLGYIPRYYSEGISARLAVGMTYECEVIEIDHEHNCEVCLKVRLSIPREEPAS